MNSGDTTFESHPSYLNLEYLLLCWKLNKEKNDKFSVEKHNLYYYYNFILMIILMWDLIKDTVKVQYADMSFHCTCLLSRIRAL